jgi:ABC-2 type transport system ATP-binding protein
MPDAGDGAPVVADGLVKRYGEITAVDNVDLRVEPGDVFGFLGPNGAGKTTTLRMLLGLIRPTDGAARLFGRDPLVDGARALEGVAGFVEAPRFYPYLSGRKNLELVAALDGNGAGDRIDEALDTVDLTPRAKHRVGGYSHGMRQRLGIAGALIRKPRLLLLDEPATGLDPAGMRDMRLLVRRLADEGITVLLSSHLLDEVEEICNRVAVIRSGRIVYQGLLDDLRATSAGEVRLRTTDDERAAVILGDLPGVHLVEPIARGLRVDAVADAVPRFSLALAEADIGVAELSLGAPTLEELFFRLTEDQEPAPLPAPRVGVPA